MLAPYDEDDVANKLVTRALFVKPLNYVVELDRTPKNGHEYIHQQRLQDVMDTKEREERWRRMPPTQKKISPKLQKLISMKTAKSNHFSEVNKNLVSNKEALKAKFTNKILPEVCDEISCCTFCLGSELCDEIFQLETHCKSLKKANPPYLSIVLYLSQHSVVILLSYMYKWYKAIGINPALCEWIYALLSCLEKPLSDECENVLVQYYEDFNSKFKRSRGNERDNIVLFTAILENHFSAHLFKVGPTLEQFWEKKF